MADETQETPKGRGRSKSGGGGGGESNSKEETQQGARKAYAAALQGVDPGDFEEKEVHDPEEAVEAGFWGNRLALPDEQFALTTGPDSP